MFVFLVVFFLFLICFLELVRQSLLAYKSLFSLFFHPWESASLQLESAWGKKKFELRNDKREFRMRLCYLEYEIIFSYPFYLKVTYDIDPLTFGEMSAVEWLRRCNAVTTPNCHKTFVDQRPCRKTPYLSKAKLLCADNYFLIINAWIGTFEICNLW